MGPLSGIEVVEIASIGPGPFCAMFLADLGAEVVRIDRISPGPDWALPPGPLERGRRSVRIDLKHPDGAALALDLAARADVLLEGFRPGVAERLGIGPADCLGRNPALVYGRATGWGQEGPLAAEAGHDLNYLGLSGVLSGIGEPDRPPAVPLNVIGDFGGGGMLLAAGVLAALVERGTSGAGQVVDAAMIDGVALQTAQIRGLLAAGLWEDRRGANLLDGAAPFYTVYETADGGYLAVAALEEPFYARLLEGLGLDPAAVPDRSDREAWPRLRRILAGTFATRTRADWEERFTGTDACVTPVLSFTEAASHPHHAARGGFVEVDGVPHPAPAPRFSRTAAGGPAAPHPPGDDTDEVLIGLGLGEDEIGRLREAGTVC